MQVTPDGSHGHLERLTDVFRVHVLTVPQHHNRARLIRQRCNQPPETFLKQRIRFRCGHGNLGQILHLNFVPKARPPQRIDAAMSRRPAQPCDAVGACFDSSPLLEQFQEDLLSHFFRDRRIVEKVKGDAVDHTLMFVNNGLKVVSSHLPSKLITIQRAITTQNRFDVSSNTV